MRKLTKTTYYSDLLECEFPTIAELKDAEKEFRKEEKLRVSLEENNNWVRLNCPSIKELDKYIMQWVEKCGTNLKSIKIRGAHFTNVSNRYAAPIGGVTNFRQEIGKPLSYPGFKFLMDFTINKEKYGFDHFPHADKIGNAVKGLYASCGGASGDNYSYSGYIFIQDFPLISARYDNFLIEKDSLDWYNRQLTNREQELDELFIKNKAASKDLTEKLAALEILNKQVKELSASIWDTSNNSIPKVIEPKIDSELINEFSFGW